MLNLSPEQIAYVVQFQHPEKLLARLPGVDDALCAAAFGLPLDRYRAIRQQFAEAARAAAQELLADATFAAQVDRLPFTAGAKLVALGDSITDDYQSWAEILRALLEARRPGHAIQIVNAGISGDTSAQVISRLLDVAQLQPDWIICMVGTNDARLHGPSPTKTLVSSEETAKNYALLRSYASSQTSARWIWMTPPTVIEEQIRAHWFLAMRQVAWRNDDLAAVASLVRQQADPVVDLQAAFGVPARPELLLDDGLHPSLEGQKLIARTLVARLSALS